jgi:hypothetical protein
MNKVSAGLNILANVFLLLSLIDFLRHDLNSASYRMEVAIFIAIMASNLSKEKD